MWTRIKKLFPFLKKGTIGYGNCTDDVLNEGQAQKPHMVVLTGERDHEKRTYKGHRITSTGTDDTTPIWPDEDMHGPVANRIKKRMETKRRGSQAYMCDEPSDVKLIGYCPESGLKKGGGLWGKIFGNKNENDND